MPVGSTELSALSLDEARELYRQLHMPVTVQSLERSRAFAWRSQQRPLGPIVVCKHWHGTAVRATTQSSHGYALTIPLGGPPCHAQFGKQNVAAVARQTGFLASPGRVVDVHVPAGYESIQLLLPTDVVREAAAALDGANAIDGDARRPIVFDAEIALAAGSGAAFLRLVQFLVAELERDVTDGLPTSSPLVTSRLVDALVYQLLASQPHNQSVNNVSRASQALGAEPIAVRRAAEYLDAHAAEPIRMAELVAVAGVGLRALQAGFRRYRGCTPLELLRERRLLLARSLLLQSPAGTVARAAHDCGFAHLGRFSAYYRERFGETPQATLRRRR